MENSNVSITTTAALSGSDSAAANNTGRAQQARTRQAFVQYHGFPVGSPSMVPQPPAFPFGHSSHAAAAAANQALVSPFAFAVPPLAQQPQTAQQNPDITSAQLTNAFNQALYRQLAQTNAAAAAAPITTLYHHSPENIQNFLRPGLQSPNMFGPLVGAAAASIMVPQSHLVNAASTVAHQSSPVVSAMTYYPQHNTFANQHSGRVHREPVVDFTRVEQSQAPVQPLQPRRINRLKIVDPETMQEIVIGGPVAQRKSATKLRAEIAPNLLEAVVQRRFEHAMYEVEDGVQVAPHHEIKQDQAIESFISKSTGQEVLDEAVEEFLASLTTVSDGDTKEKDELRNQFSSGSGNEPTTKNWFPESFTNTEGGMFEVAVEGAMLSDDDETNMAGVDENGPCTSSDDEDVVVVNSKLKEGEQRMYTRDFVLNCYINQQTRERPEFFLDKSVAMLATISGNLTDVLLKSRDVFVGAMASGARRTASSRLQRTQGQRQYFGPRRGSQRYYNPIQPEVQLHRTNNPYKVLDKSELTESQLMEKRFRELLNKVSPENEPNVMQEIRKLEFRSPDDMNGPMEIIFDKAVYEPQYRSIYARIAQYLCSNVSFRYSDPVNEAEEAPKVSVLKFKVLLLKRVENAFKTKFSEDGELSKMLAKRDSATSEADRNHCQSVYNELFSMRKRKYLGLTEFIGHLFLIGVLNERIIKNCAERLLKPAEDEKFVQEWQLESMIKLLGVIGERLDKTSKENLLPKFLSNIDKELDHLDDDRRVRWMFDDLRNRRANGWVSKTSSQGKLMDEAKTMRPPRGADLQFDRRPEGFGRATKVHDPEMLYNQRLQQLDNTGDKIINMYLKSADMDVALKSLSNITTGLTNQPNLLLKIWSAIVCKGFDIACDKRESDVVQWTKILCHAVKTKTMPRQSFVEGVHLFWAAAESLILDVPLVYEYVGASLVPLLAHEDLGISIEEIYEPIRQEGGCVQAVGNMLRRAQEAGLVGNVVSTKAKRILATDEMVRKCTTNYGVHFE
ncbi:hypothetical protein ACOME3_001367 [Neoechinorhynchus agilis]